MIILNTEKLIKIVYRKKMETTKYFIDDNKEICTMYYGFDSISKTIVGEKAIKVNNCYQEGELFYYLPHFVFYSDNNSTETVYLKTEELAQKLIDKIKQEPNLKTFTIE